jgi:polyhydroxybutyrate depolymerase
MTCGQHQTMIDRSRPTSLAVASLILMVGLALLAAGCGLGARRGTASPPATAGADGTVVVPVGSSTQHLSVGGRSRSFRVYRPATLSSQGPTPLVVMLHGGYGNADNAESDYGWDGQADTDHFVMAYPDGLNHAWNVGGGCCGTPGRDQVDDVAFITHMVTTIGRELAIDPARIYATGISNGGLMAYRLACDTDVFAAIGPDSATLMGTCPSPAPVSVIHIHGLSDDRIPFTGGPGGGFATVVNGPPVPTVVAMWRSVDRCATPTVTTAGVVTTSVATCPSGRSVELITIAGAGHQWPGGKAPGLVGRAIGLDEPSTALAATPTIWAFFQAHPKS